MYIYIYIYIYIYTHTHLIKFVYSNNALFTTSMEKINFYTERIILPFQFPI